MPKLKLTKTSIDKDVKSDPAGDVLYWDTVTRGFGCRVTPKGVISFVAQGRVKGTTTDRRTTIGTYGAWTVDDARRKAEEYRHQLEDGVDPQQAKKEAEKQAEDDKQAKAAQVTLGDVSNEYLAIGRLKPKTAHWFTYYVNTTLADWKDKPIASITRDMVKLRHAELKENGLHGKKGAPASANAAFVVLRTLINFAIEDQRLPDGSKLITENPVGVLRKRWAPAGDRTERYVPVDKVGDVWNALQQLRLTTVKADTQSGVDLAVFLLLTGARLQEGAALTWDRLHIDDAEPAKSYWHLIERKVGKPLKLPLSKQAIALLKGRPRVEGNPHVFASRGVTGHVMDPRSTLEKVSEVAGLHLSNHDLRRTFSEVSVKACRIERFRADLLIGHKPDPRDVGANSYLALTDVRRLYPEVQQIADHMEGQGRIAEAKANVSNVVTLPVRA